MKGLHLPGRYLVPSRATDHLLEVNIPPIWSLVNTGRQTYCRKQREGR